MTPRLLIAAALLATAAPAGAFGLKTHVYIADQVWQDLADCRVTIRGADFAVPQRDCRAIRGHRGEFLAGALGPDVFPDVLVGQAIVHPGVAHGRQASDWLGALLAGAQSDEEIAFAWGYAMHFAGDVFAHSYVNNYAGGVFEITESRAKGIELRHYRLEKYIDQHLDYRLDPAAFAVPAPFLSRTLIQYDYGGGALVPGSDLYAAARRDPAAFLRQADQRMRSASPAAAAVTTLFVMLDLARAAKARAPEDEARERAGLDASLAALRTLEQTLGVAPTQTLAFDQRSPEYARLSNNQRTQIQTAYRLHRTRIEAWQQARALTAFTAVWADDLELVAERYIEASLDFGVEMIRGGDTSGPMEERTSALLPYRRWTACYLPVLEGAPAAAGDATCRRLRAMGSDLQLRRAAVLAALGAQPRGAYYRLLQIDRYLSQLVDTLIIRLIGIGDRNFTELLDEGRLPMPVSAATLNRTFAEAPNRQLAFRCVQDWIDADLGMRAPLATGVDAPCDAAPRSRETLDPQAFAALDNALTLARLALLDQAGLRQVAARFGADPAALRLGNQQRYSLLLDSVKSLDGSQQWHGQALPFPQARAYGRTPPLRSFGYAPGESGHAGFPFYQSEALRRTAFTALFRPFEGAILTRPEMQGAAYPFRPCAGDPLRPAAAGAATEIC